MSSAHETASLKKSRRNDNSGLGLKDITVVDNATLKKAVSAAALGNAMEWFDFGVFSLVAIAIGHNFFPSESKSIQLLSAFAVFAVAFFARPLGGFVFGPLGDRIGRKQVLALTMIMMAISTFCIGLIPSFSAIGIWAPILLIAMRLVQGFSAGGEYGGAATFVAEYSPDRKRGFMGSWLEVGTFAGFILASLTVTGVTYCTGEDAMNDWAWRIPFFIAGPLGLIGLYLRTRLEETPAFAEHAEKEKQEKRESDVGSKFGKMFGQYWKQMLICIGLVLLMNVSTYLLTTVMPSYMQSHVPGIGATFSSLAMTIVMCSMLILLPIMGLLTDRIGRKPLIIIGCLITLLLAVPLLRLIQTGDHVMIYAGLLGFALIQSCFSSAMPSKLPSLFPTSVRYGALAIAYNISVALFAGPTPGMNTWLIEATGNIDVPAYYWMAAAVIGLITIILTRETASRPLEGSAPSASTPEEAKELLEEHKHNLESQYSELTEEMKELEEKRNALVSENPELKNR